MSEQTAFFMVSSNVQIIEPAEWKLFSNNILVTAFYLSFYHFLTPDCSAWNPNLLPLRSRDEHFNFLNIVCQVGRLFWGSGENGRKRRIKITKKWWTYFIKRPFTKYARTKRGRGGFQKRAMGREIGVSNSIFERAYFVNGTS